MALFGLNEWERVVIHLFCGVGRYVAEGAGGCERYSSAYVAATLGAREVSQSTGKTLSGKCGGTGVDINQQKSNVHDRDGAGISSEAPPPIRVSLDAPVLLLCEPRPLPGILGAR